MQETITLSDGTVVQTADFQFDFSLGKKADVQVAENGKLVIEGYASDFGLDRHDEAFEPGAFDAGLNAYLETNPILLYHHKADTALGVVKKAVVDDKGLWVRAEIDEPEPNTPTADYYRKIKNGVIRGFSVAGAFLRRMTRDGPRIFKADIREVSVTPLPINPRTMFAVVGKAFENMETPVADNTETPLDTTDLEARLAQIDLAFTNAEKAVSIRPAEYAGAHPDGPKIAALLKHMVDIHTLATNVKQDAVSENVRNRASAIADHARAHIAALHQLAAEHGPIPNTYAGEYL